MNTATLTLSPVAAPQAADVRRSFGSMSVLMVAQQAYESVPEAPFLQNRIAETAAHLAQLITQAELLSGVTSTRH